MSKPLHDKHNAFNTFAHDLNTPITAIKASLDMLEILGADNPRQKQYIDRAFKSIERIEEMATNLLEYARLGTNYTPEMKPCDLTQILHDVIEASTTIATKYDVAVSSEIAPLPILNGNAHLLHSLFLNLLTNAVKYNRPGGKAHLHAITDEHNIIVTITDEGIGIPAEEQAHIYESFYRAHNSQTTHGAGLGLAIVRDAVNLHGGAINLMSNVGIGTTFTVTLPYAPDTTPSDSTD